MVLWAVPTKRHVTLDEAVALMQLEEKACADDVHPPTNDMEDELAVRVDEEDAWDLGYILPSVAIYFGPHSGRVIDDPREVSYVRLKRAHESRRRLSDPRSGSKAYQGASPDDGVTSCGTSVWARA